ncbi:MAG: hypothetical protein Tp1111DCM1126091_13 [Prokaryotic dsDNA virus sp.]|nr:MAG: hypothetical protein Tp1111DCM1126091_13 [Prokaryotic dsDNA virus sp.]|tara:strand:- start:8675 stop:8887 length:213 start_codon:yes stop_codon:yes gene_type:complete
MTKPLNGYYTAKERIRVRCGVSTFQLPEGAKVFAEQFDWDNKKVLVRFGGRDIDWMSMRTFEECFKQGGE